MNIGDHVMKPAERDKPNGVVNDTYGILVDFAPDGDAVVVWTHYYDSRNDGEKVVLRDSAWSTRPGAWDGRQHCWPDELVVVNDEAKEEQQ